MTEEFDVDVSARRRYVAALLGETLPRPSVGRAVGITAARAGEELPASLLDEVFSAVSLEREMTGGPVDRHGRWAGEAVWDINDPWVSGLIAGQKPAATRDGALCQCATRVIVTHDVDRVTLTEPISFAKRIAVDMARGAGRRFSMRSAIDRRGILRAVERILEIEAAWGVRPWFFMLAGRYGLGRFSNRYGIRWRKAREVISMIREAGGILGLHGSYYAKDRDSYAAEAALLAGIADQPVVAHRQHYLRFDPRRFWSQLEAAGIRLDFSLCLPSGLGFRVPLTGPFHPFDWEFRRASSVLAIPTIAMDRPWWLSRQDEVLSSLERLLRATSDVGGAVAILVHPEVFAVDEAWFPLFEDILGLCSASGADLGVAPSDLRVAPRGAR